MTLVSLVLRVGSLRREGRDFTKSNSDEDCVVLTIELSALSSESEENSITGDGDVGILRRPKDLRKKTTMTIHAMKKKTKII